MDAFFESLLDRLSDEFREVRDGIPKAIQGADYDPEMALTRIRKILEYVLREIYERRLKKHPGKNTIESLLHPLKDSGLPQEKWTQS